MDVRFKLPANVYIYGQSQSGKSCLVRSMLHRLNERFDPLPTRLIYCLGEYQTMFDDMVENGFVKGFPDNLHDMLGDDNNSLIIVDDLMLECSKDQRMTELFTPGSH